MLLADRSISACKMTSTKYVLSILLATILPLPWQMIAQAQPTVDLVLAQGINATEEVIIYVDPQQGDDSQTGVDPDSPLKTITKALEIAQPGMTIKLAQGTYSEESGEVFPIIVKTNVTLKGSPSGKGHRIIIQGNGYFISHSAAGQNVAIAAIKQAGTITGLTVINSHSRGHGLWIESASPKVIGNTFTRNGNTGLSVNGNSSPLIEDNHFYKNAGNGLLVYGTSQPEVKNNFFENTGFGVSLVEKAAPILSGNSFTGNRIGIILEGESQGLLRNNKIETSNENGLTAIANSRVDLGTTDEPGNNIFRGNKKLDIQNATNNEIVAVGTETNGQTAGSINFSSGNSPLVAFNTPSSSSLPPAQLSLETSDRDRPLASRSLSDSSSLPSPPSLPHKTRDNKEFVFTAPREAQPVPFPPETNSSDVLPSPPSVSLSQTPLNSKKLQIGSLSDVLGSSNSNPVRYKVLVEVSDSDDLENVRELYPEAFPTVYRGKSALQVGAFTNWDKAKQASNSLEDLGFDSHILE